MAKFELIDYPDSGWPFPVMSAHELTLINCPNLVLPPGFTSRDMIAIIDGTLKITITFDNKVFVEVKGVRIPHTEAAKRVGKPLSNMIGVTHLTGHPLASRIMATIDVFEDGVDIELED